LIAALSLLVAGFWLLRQGRPARYALVPAVFMLATTLAAFGWQMRETLAKADYLLTGVLGLLLALAGTALFDGLRALRLSRA
jgi:carbon starvation protein